MIDPPPSGWPIDGSPAARQAILSWVRSVLGAQSNWYCIVADPPLPDMSARLETDLDPAAHDAATVTTWGVRGWAVCTADPDVLLWLVAWALDSGVDSVIAASAPEARPIEALARGHDDRANAIAFDWGRPVGVRRPTR